MKTILATLEEPESIYAVTLSIDDKEAMDACMRFEFTGFNIADALKNANKKLNPLGFRVVIEGR